MSTYKVEAKTNCPKCCLGEGPHWDAERQELYFVDGMGNSVYRYVPATDECFEVSFGEKKFQTDITSFDTYTSIIIPIYNQKGKFLVTIKREVKLLEWDGKSKQPTSLKTLFEVDEHEPTNLINDGKCDAKGRLWAGSLGITPGKSLGSLYSFMDGKKEKKFGDVGIANGLCWSKDNRIFYYIDSYAYRIDAYDFDLESGAISNRRTIFEFKVENEGELLDGMTIDENGNLWVAVFMGGRVIQVDPIKQKQIGQVDIPYKNPTSVAFGGPNLDVLYVTSTNFCLTKEQLVEMPLAGSLFEVKGLGVKGISGGVPYKGTF